MLAKNCIRVIVVVIVVVVVVVGIVAVHTLTRLICSFSTLPVACFCSSSKRSCLIFASCSIFSSSFVLSPRIRLSRRCNDCMLKSCRPQTKYQFSQFYSAGGSTGLGRLCAIPSLLEKFLLILLHRTCLL